MIERAIRKRLLADAAIRVVLFSDPNIISTILHGEHAIVGVVGVLLRCLVGIRDRGKGARCVVAVRHRATGVIHGARNTIAGVVIQRDRTAAWRDDLID